MKDLLIFVYPITTLCRSGIIFKIYAITWIAIFILLRSIALIRSYVQAMLFQLFLLSNLPRRLFRLKLWKRLAFWMKGFQWATVLTTIIRFGVLKVASVPMFCPHPDSIIWSIGIWLTKRNTSGRRAMNAGRVWKRSTEKIGAND